MKTSTKIFCDTIATSTARYEKYRCWACQCPIYVELHRNQAGTSRMSLGAPNRHPGTLSRRTDHQIQGGPGSVRFGYGLGMERFKRFRFSVLAVPLQKGFFCVSVEFNRKGRFRFRFRFLENGSGGSGSAFGFRKNSSDGSGSGSGSVPEPPCNFLYVFFVYRFFFQKGA